VVPIEKLDLLILKTLALEPLHGYGIGQRIEQMSDGVFRLTLGALYPALQRLERNGLIRGRWATSDNNRRARYYTLTPAGRRRLGVQQKAWAKTAAAMMRILGAVPAARRG
jgi:PadR family transcriptional regulator PadR